MADTAVTIARARRRLELPPQRLQCHHQQVQRHAEAGLKSDRYQGPLGLGTSGICRPPKPLCHLCKSSIVSPCYSPALKIDSYASDPSLYGNFSDRAFEQIFSIVSLSASIPLSLVSQAKTIALRDLSRSSIFLSKQSICWLDWSFRKS